MVYKRKKKSPPEKASAPSEKCVAQSSGRDGKEGQEKGAAEAMEADGQAPASDPLLAAPTKDGSDQPKKDPENVPPSGAAAQLAPQPPQPTRFSARVAQKRPRRDSTPPATTSSTSAAAKKTCQTTAKTEPEDNTRTKRRRQWESWSVEDKDLFFEALCEHGKDFDAIHHVLLVRNKKKGDATVTKTKEQIRHFYYRTWQKIYKHLGDIKYVKNKQAAELYGLINYGEMRKKLGPVLNEKTAEKLNELLHHGVTFCKVKGKNKRISTPVCRALKKLHNFEERESERLKVPDKVIVELQPKTTAAWTKVQSFAQNPRLRLNLKGNKRLVSLFNFLEKKWISQDDYVRTKLLKDDDEADVPMTSELRLYPPADVKLSSFAVKPVETQQPVTFSLDKFITIAQRAEAAQVTKKVRQKGGASAAAEKPTTTSNSAHSLSSNDTKSQSVESVNDPSRIESHTESASSCPNPPSASGPLLSFKGAISNPDVVAATLKLPAASKDGAKGEIKEEETVASSAAGSAPDKNDTNPSSSTENNLERFRKGWTKSTAGNMTMAEVYLLFDAPKKIVLEYEWTDVNPQFSFLNDENLTNVLRRLVHIAITEFVDVSRSKSQPSAVPGSLACEQCGRGLGKSPRAGKNGSPATPKGSARSRARTNSDSGSNTPKSRGSSNTATTPKGRASAASLSTANQSASVANTEKVGEQPTAVQQSSDDGVFRIPNAVPPPRPSGASQQSTQPVNHNNNVQKTQIQNYVIPPRPRMRRPLRKPLIVQRKLLPKSNSQSRQLVTFAIGQNGSLIPIVPDSDGDSGSFSQLPPPGGTIIRSPTGRTVSNKEGMRTLSLTSAAGQRVVARQLIPGPEGLPGPDSSSEKEVVRALTSAAGQRVVARKLIPDPEVIPPTNVPVSPTKDLTSTPLKSMQPAVEPAVMSQSLTCMTENGTTLTTLTPVPLVKSVSNDMSNLNNVSLSDAALPPPNISSLLDISLPSTDAVHTDGSAEKFIDIALENTNASFTAFLDNSTLQDPLATPTKPLDTSLVTENAWLNGELQDFSLSNLLGESPAKREVPPASTVLMCESSRDSLSSRFDVDSAFQSMMNENSLDYMAKFADLAAQISASHRKPEETL